MNKLVSAFVIGIVFGLGILMSGMINPAKVLNFFDIAGTWDPSLAFVMGGGLAVAIVGYQWSLRMQRRPVFEPDFAVPTRRDINWQLVGDAAIFGVGWGIAGFCPGGAIPALGLGHIETVVFVATMIAGIIFARAIRTRMGTPALA